MEYHKKYTALLDRYERIQKELEENANIRLERNARRERITSFIDSLKKNDTIIAEFDEDLWKSVIEAVMVYQQKKLCFVFKDGKKIEWEI